MRIILHTIQAGPKGVRHPGVYDLPEAEARALIESHHASEAPAATTVEAATVAAPETATLTSPRGRVIAPTARGK